MFEIGISTTGKKIDEALFHTLAEGGIKYVEVSMGSEDYKVFDFKAARKWADNAGVNLWTFHLPFKPFNELDISY